MVLSPYPPRSIMRTSLLLTSSLLSLALLTACGQNITEKLVENAIEKETGGQANVDIANGTMKVQTSEGNFEVGGNTLPKDWPTDAPTYPGANIQYSASGMQDSGAGQGVMLITQDSLQTVIDFYTEQMKKNGWTIEGSMNAGTTSTIGGSKGNRVLTVVISAVDGTTNITLALGTK